MIKYKFTNKTLYATKPLDDDCSYDLAAEIIIEYVYIYGPAYAGLTSPVNLSATDNINDKSCIFLFMDSGYYLTTSLDSMMAVDTDRISYGSWTPLLSFSYSITPTPTTGANISLWIGISVGIIALILIITVAVCCMVAKKN
jgi:hypothetical protein